MSYFRKLIDRKYSQVRGMDASTDIRIEDRDVAEFVLRRIGQRVRAVRRRVRSGFVDKAVVLAHRRHLTLGVGVVLGRGVTIDALSLDGVSLADGVTVGPHAEIRGSGVIRSLGKGVVVGSHTSIGSHNFIHGGGGVVVGRDCLLGPYVSVFSENHSFHDLDTPIRLQGEVPAPVVVEDNVWIGAGATILAGVTVGEGSVVAAGSVVNRDVPPFAVVGGAPAKLLRSRRQLATL